MIELQLFVASLLSRFDLKLADNFDDSDMAMTDGFSGGPVGRRLPMHLSVRK